MRKALYLMGILNDSDIEWIAKNGGNDFVKSGTVLIREKTPIESLYIVLDGKLTVNIAALGNKEVAALYAGEIVGEMSFVDSSPPSASVSAILDSRVLSLPRSLLMEKLTGDLGFASRFYHGIATFLAQRLRVTTSRLGYGGASQDEDPSELDESSMDNLAVAAARFDDLLRRLRIS
jgi:CRP-like cAMP-binding protein